MPFGDNIVTLLAGIGRNEFYESKGRGDIPTEQVCIERVQPPEWWSEYLLEAWKRKNRIDQPRRDRRTGWKRADDQWRAEQRLTAGVGFIKAPLHPVWGNKE